MRGFAQLLVTAFAAVFLVSASGVDGVDVRPVSQEVAMLLARSQALQTQRQFPEAEAMLRQFLTTGNILPTNKILVLNALGALMTALDRCDEAESNFQRALYLAEHNPEIVPLALVRIRFNLVGLYIENRRYGKAQILLDKVSEADASEPHERWRLASLRGTLAIVRKDYELGNQIFESHLRNLDPSKPSAELATTLNNLGRIALSRKDYAAASRYLAPAASAWHASSDARQSSLARTLVNLAVALQHMGDNDGAQESVKEALNIARTQLGDNHPATTGIYDVCADVLAKIGSKREARELKRTAQRIRQQTPSQFPAGAVVDISALSAFP